MFQSRGTIMERGNGGERGKGGREERGKGRKRGRKFEIRERKKMQLLIILNYNFYGTGSVLICNVELSRSIHCSPSAVFSNQSCSKKLINADKPKNFY